MALVALFLLRGNLPWKPRPHGESHARSWEIVRKLKEACSGPLLSSGFPSEFGDLLDDSRTLPFHQLPDYETVRHSFASLAQRMGYSLLRGSLDWTPCHHEFVSCVDEPELLDSFLDDDDDDATDDRGTETYYGWDYDSWEPRQSLERDLDVSLMAPLHES